MSSDNIDTTSLPAPPVVAAPATSNPTLPNSPVCINGTARTPPTLPSESAPDSIVRTGAEPSEPVPMETSPADALPTEASPVRASSVGASPSEVTSAEAVQGDEPSSQGKASYMRRNRNGRPSNINENSLLRRLECVMSVELGRVTMGTACEQYAISSRTFYRWLKSKDRLYQLTGFTEEDFKCGSPLQNAQRSTMQRMPRDGFRKIPTFLPATTRASPAVAGADVDNLPRLPTQPKVSPNRSQSLPILSTSNHEIGLPLYDQDAMKSQLQHYKGPQVDIRPTSSSDQHRCHQNRQHSSVEIMREDRDQILLPDQHMGERHKQTSASQQEQQNSSSIKRRKLRTSAESELHLDPSTTMTVKRPRSLGQAQNVSGMMVIRRNGSMVTPNALTSAPVTSPTVKHVELPSGPSSLPSQPSGTTSNKRPMLSYSADMLDNDWQTQRDDDEGEELPDEQDDPSTNVDSGSGSPATMRRRRMEVCNTVGGDELKAEPEEHGIKSDATGTRPVIRSSAACDGDLAKAHDNSGLLINNVSSSPGNVLTSKIDDEAVVAPGISEASLATRLVAGNDNASLAPTENINSSNALECDGERNMEDIAVCRGSCVSCHPSPHKHRIEVILDRRKATIAWYPGALTSDIKAAIARRFALLPDTQWMLIDKSRDEIVISPGVPSGCYTLSILS